MVDAVLVRPRPPLQGDVLHELNVEGFEDECVELWLHIVASCTRLIWAMLFILLHVAHLNEHHVTIVHLQREWVDQRLEAEYKMATRARRRVERKQLGGIE